MKRTVTFALAATLLVAGPAMDAEVSDGRTFDLGTTAGSAGR
ncbi:MAG: hypothetical protein VYE73_09335 [Acidobacteriota bacterium]|nr:hypothetical protein [Acidobacteriota bacterium]